MRRRGFPAGFRTFLATLAVLLATAAGAQVRTEIKVTDSSSATTAVSPDNVTSLLRQGQQLEQQRRWGEALAHYENAIRQYPDDGTLQQRFDAARLPLRPGTPLRRSQFLRLGGADAAAAGVGSLRPGAVEDRIALRRVAALERPGRSRNEQLGSGPERAGVHRAERAAAGSRGRSTPFAASCGTLVDAKAVNTRADARDAVAVAAGLAQQPLGDRPGRRGAGIPVRRDQLA